MIESKRAKEKLQERINEKRKKELAKEKRKKEKIFILEII